MYCFLSGVAGLAHTRRRPTRLLHEVNLRQQSLAHQSGHFTMGAVIDWDSAVAGYTFVLESLILCWFLCPSGSRKRGQWARLSEIHARAEEATENWSSYKRNRIDRRLETEIVFFSHLLWCWWALFVDYTARPGPVNTPQPLHNHSTMLSAKITAWEIYCTVILLSCFPAIHHLSFCLAYRIMVGLRSDDIDGWQHAGEPVMHQVSTRGVTKIPHSHLNTNIQQRCGLKRQWF